MLSFRNFPSMKASDLSEDHSGYRHDNYTQSPPRSTFHHAGSSSCCLNKDVDASCTSVEEEEVTTLSSCVSSRVVNRCASLSFDENVRVIIIPRIRFQDEYDDHDHDDGGAHHEDIDMSDLVKKEDLFYQQHEINLWRCEEQMRKAGINPDAFDWRNMR